MVKIAGARGPIFFPERIFLFWGKIAMVRIAVAYGGPSDRRTIDHPADAERAACGPSARGAPAARPGGGAELERRRAPYARAKVTCWVTYDADRAVSRNV